MDVLMAGGKGKSASAFQTPPPTVNGPTPKSKSKETEVPKGASGVKVDLKKRLDPNEVARTQGKDPPATEAAKLARLRRLCEKKPSGKCNVPEELHKRWLHGSLQDREALVEELEAAHWSKDHLFEKNKFQSVYQSMLLWNGTYVFSLIILDSPRVFQIVLACFFQDLFVSRVTKTITKTNKLTRKKKRGWFTKETMNTVLKWSSFLALNLKTIINSQVNMQISKYQFTLLVFVITSNLQNITYSTGIPTYSTSIPMPAQPRTYIKSVVAYCEKPGNERLVKTLTCK